MSRPYHSASSAKLGARCQRAWAYRYVDGLREPEVPWSEIEAGRQVAPRVRAVALGKAVHAVGESWYRSGGSPDWLRLPGEIYAAGLHLLPQPPGFDLFETEHPIGLTPSAEAPGGFVFRHGDISWAGFRDLAARDRDGRWWQYDYKTTSSIERWAMSPEQLRVDLQCCLYSLDLARRTGQGSILSRWIYLETTARRAAAVDIEVTRAQASDIVEAAATLCRELDLIERSQDAPQNHDACRDYGGCPFHVHNGGPCDARLTLRAAFAAQRKDLQMAQLDPALIAKFGVPVKAPEPAPDPGPTEPVGFGGAPLPAPPCPALASPPEKPKRGRPSKAQPAEDTAPVEDSDDLASDLIAMAEELRAAKSALLAAQAQHADVIARITARVSR